MNEVLVNVSHNNVWKVNTLDFIEIFQEEATFDLYSIVSSLTDFVSGSDLVSVRSYNF